jgi:hypothetical protein
VIFGPEPIARFDDENYCAALQISIISADRIRLSANEKEALRCLTKNSMEAVSAKRSVMR